MSMWRTPSGLSASITALAIAGVEPIVAASPMPCAHMCEMSKLHATTGPISSRNRFNFTGMWSISATRISKQSVTPWSAAILPCSFQPYDLRSVRLSIIQQCTSPIYHRARIASPRTHSRASATRATGSELCTKTREPCLRRYAAARPARIGRSCPAAAQGAAGPGRVRIPPCAA